MKRLLLLLGKLLTAILPTLAYAQQPRKTAEKLDEYIASANRVYRFNGSVLVARKGRVLLHKAYGLADVATKMPIDTSTIFPVLSITKTFTSTVILKLQEQGILSVEDNLSRYFPDFPNGDQIKLRHLLTHTAGLSNYTDVIGEEDSAIVCHPVPKQRVLDIFWNKPADFLPGKQFSYNNSGYFLLGMIIEKVTGKPYETTVREMIFNPLGMTHSGFDYNNRPAATKAQGYDTLTATYQSPYRHVDSTVVYSAGAMYSTTGDMYKWARAIATQNVLTTASWKQAFTPYLEHYGYGWETGNYFGKAYIRHSGGYPGFMADFVYYPDDDITIILFNNFGNYGDSLFPLVMGLSSVVMNKPYDLWQLRRKVTVDQVTLNQYVGKYVLNRKISMEIVVKEGRLYALGKSATQMPELALYASGQTTFFPQTFNNQITFVTDKSGKAAKLILREHGANTEWRKIN